ncbi:MAG: DegT/DnrJ/EryC1/StrS family aminotransferase [Flavobacteriales bacterium AspAUS03]
MESYFDGKALETFGNVGVFSFNENKIVTNSTGRTIIISRSKYDKKMRYLAAQDKNELSYYLHTDMEYNYRMSHIYGGVSG